MKTRAGAQMDFGAEREVMVRRARSEEASDRDSHGGVDKGEPPRCRVSGAKEQARSDG